MTRMEPIIVTTHMMNGHAIHIAWSPNHYHINNINVHPLLNPVYQNFMNAIRNHIQNHMDPMHHSHTDFHNNTTLHNRGATAYFCVLNDHVVSPVFFTIDEVHTYVNNHPYHHTIYVADHRYL